MGNMFLLKTDGSGNNVWFEPKGYDDSYEDAQSVQQTSDGGYIVVGATGQFNHNLDVFLVKTHPDGTNDWYRHIGGTYDDLGYSVRQTSDGGYIIAGSSSSPGAGSRDVYLIKTDQTGAVQWERYIGGSADDGANWIENTADGGFVVAGTTESRGAGNSDAWLLKLNATGDTTWTRTFGGAEADVATAVQQTSDGGYVVTGCTKSSGAGGSDVWLIKTDMNGKVK